MNDINKNSKLNKENGIIITLTIILVIVIVILSVLIFKNKIKIENKNDTKYFSCSQLVKDLQFAELSTYYNFYYKDYNIYNAIQIYTFKFYDSNYYNSISTSELFTMVNPNMEVFDEENLIKTYYINTTIPYKNLESVDDYIRLVNDYGYSCTEQNT